MISSGVLRFQIFQSPHQRIEFGIVDLRLVEDVIQIFVVANLFAQRFDLFCGVFADGHRKDYRRKPYAVSVRLSGRIHLRSDMRKAALLYNPDSGGSRGNREAELESVAALLRREGVTADLVLTDSPADAEAKTRVAVDAGCDTVFACGGDGTIHNIVQVLAKTEVALAIMPMGTANALAHDLGLPMKLSAAARAALEGTARRVALGRIEYSDLQGQPGARYFIVAAGAGVDAHLFYKLHTGTKKRMGMAAYYAKAWHLWFSYPMTRFQVETD